MARQSVAWKRLAAAFAVVSLTASAAEAGCSVYQHRDYGGARWGLGSRDELQMGGGEPMGKTGDGRIYYQPSWNDQVSSLKVTPGCTLTLWQHAGTSGGGATFTANKNYKYVGSSWNDQASWAYCYCQ